MLNGTICNGTPCSLNCNFGQILFSFIACCPSLNVILENDVKEKQGEYEGIYTFQGFNNGMDYWVDADGVHAIWYNTEGSSYYWVIGKLSYLGSLTVAVYSSSDTLEKKCPNNEGYVWNWIYDHDYSWKATNDVYIKCLNEDDFCTSENPCRKDQGDCDTHDECQDGLFCESNNCPDYLGFDTEYDCCYAPTVGHEHFCTTVNPCAVDEGDCDFDDECQTDLICDTGNDCSSNFGINYRVDCCQIGMYSYHLYMSYIMNVKL